MPSDKKKIDAIVVTYNRKELLARTIKAILNQTYSIRFLYIIDNASTDGTREYLRQKKIIPDEVIRYVSMKKNTGGAGGFYKGIRLGMNGGADYIWVMDDDVLPAKDCLEKLIGARKIVENERFSFLASTIYGKGGEFMNVPTISYRPSGNGYAGWYEHLENGIIKIKSATFVSILLNRDAVAKCGLPCKDFFIWGDDTEYTTRLTTYYGDAYFVGSSKAIHLRRNSMSISEEIKNAPKRGKNYHYLYRNSAINDQFYKGRPIVFELFKSIIRLMISLIRKQNILIDTIRIKGNFEALIEYGYFKRYIDHQLRGRCECESLNRGR